jgi:hypothetical protein
LKKNSLSIQGDFFPKFRQKNQRFWFGHLEPIWDGFGCSKYLAIWAFGHLDGKRFMTGTQ